ncbi:MAG: CDC27 family protein [Saprospiraceae bacterium]|nr:CDC27 family protein [Saprospiraceae bacterium]
MVDLSLHEKIETYLLGLMSREETAKFKEQIKNDPQLAEEVELHRLILPVPDRLAEIELHRDFKRWYEEIFPSPTQRIISKAQKRLISIFIIMLLIIFCVFLIWNFMAAQRAQQKQLLSELEDIKLENQGIKEELSRIQSKLDSVLQRSEPENEKKPKIPNNSEYVKLAEEGLMAYAEYMVESFRTRSVHSTLVGEKLIENADTAIQKGQFREAEWMLRSVSTNDRWHPKSLEILAFVQFKLQKYKEAIDTYEEYRKYNRDKDKTDWDLCLFYLGDFHNYKQQVKRLLLSIREDLQHPKRNEADVLYNKIQDSIGHIQK